MKIALGCDHGGYELKQHIIKVLEYAMKAYNAPSIKNDTLPQITIARMLTALNYALSRFSQACSMATEGSALAHAVGFPAYFPTPTPSFHSATYRLASGVGFSACFSHPTPTPWVFPLIFLLSRPVSAPQHID